jgi:hypothetical protein
MITKCCEDGDSTWQEVHAFYLLLETTVLALLHAGHPLNKCIPYRLVNILKLPWDPEASQPVDPLAK